MKSSSDFIAPIKTSSESSNPSETSSLNTSMETWIQNHREEYLNNEHELFLIAAARGLFSTINTLLRFHEINVGCKNKALFLACKNGHASIVNTLIRVEGIDALQIDQNGNTLLMIAVFNDHQEIVTTLLADTKIDPNQLNAMQSTALMIAARYKNSAMIETLLGDTRVDPNIVSTNPHYHWGNYNTNTALTIAMGFADGDTKSANILIKDGRTDVYFEDSNSMNALIISANLGYENLISVLLETKTFEPRDLNLALFQCQGHHKNHPKIIEMLLSEPHIDPNSRHGVGSETLLTYLCSRVYCPEREQIIQILISHPKIDPNQTNQHHTPLMLAAGYGNHKIIELLLAHKDLNHNQTNRHQETALIYAIRNKDAQTISSLLQSSQIQRLTQEQIGKLGNDCRENYLTSLDAVIKPRKSRFKGIIKASMVLKKLRLKAAVATYGLEGKGFFALRDRWAEQVSQLESTGRKRIFSEISVIEDNSEQSTPAKRTRTALSPN